MSAIPAKTKRFFPIANLKLDGVSVYFEALERGGPCGVCLCLRTEGAFTVKIALRYTKDLVEWGAVIHQALGKAQGKNEEH